MQVLWMLLVTMGLVLVGVLGLAVVAHLTARTRTAVRAVAQPGLPIRRPGPGRTPP
jgi:hypothetical protein